jgi:hypothetical protein
VSRSLRQRRGISWWWSDDWFGGVALDVLLRVVVLWLSVRTLPPKWAYTEYMRVQNIYRVRLVTRGCHLRQDIWNWRKISLGAYCPPSYAHNGWIDWLLLRRKRGTYVLDFSWRLGTFLFRFSAHPVAAFTPSSRIEHAPERRDQISEPYISSRGCSVIRRWVYWLAHWAQCMPSYITTNHSPLRVIEPWC